MPAAAANITTSNIGCNTFTASVAGQTNLTNPEYCLYNSSNVLIGCNTTGNFDNLAYNTSYCIRINNDDCYDTTIVRCFTTVRPVPKAGTNVDISNKGCSTFTAKITGQENLDNPTYCLYNGTNTTLIVCNTTGTFDSLAYGSYCIRIQNNTACYDTTITRCFTVTRPVPAVAASVTISNKACSTFTAKITGQSNLTTPKYVLYNASDIALDSNATGTFNNVLYGSYCIKVVNTCYDTTITRCFTVNQLVPSVGSVAVSNKACSTFTATVTGQTNLNSPVYNMYDTLGNLVATSTNGVFNNLSYGSYCLKITTPCYDTTITRCFTANPVPIDITVTAKESCTFGTTDLSVVFNSGNVPYHIEVLNPVDVLVTSVTSSTSPVAITALSSGFSAMSPTRISHLLPGSSRRGPT